MFSSKKTAESLNQPFNIAYPGEVKEKKMTAVTNTNTNRQCKHRHLQPFQAWPLAQDPTTAQGHQPQQDCNRVRLQLPTVLPQPGLRPSLSPWRCPVPGLGLPLNSWGDKGTGQAARPYPDWSMSSLNTPQALTVPRQQEILNYTHSQEEKQTSCTKLKCMLIINSLFFTSRGELSPQTQCLH